MLPTLEQVGAMLLVSSIKAEHIAMYTKSSSIDRKVNIADVPVRALTGESEAWCIAACDNSNDCPELELQVRFETCGGQCLRSDSRGGQSMQHPNGARQTHSHCLADRQNAEVAQSIDFGRCDLLDPARSKFLTLETG